MNLLELKNLSLSVAGIGRPIVDAVSLSLERGDFLVILGTNGSGKSSLLRLINGTYLPDQGEVFCLDERMTDLTLTQRAQTIATLTQDLQQSTFGGLTVEENCLCAMERQIPRKALKEYLSRFHPSLCRHFHERVKELSGGERQCLALAMSLLREPALLLLDEHTSALDPRTAQRVMELTYTESKNCTIAMTTHNLDDALRYGNRLVMMSEGKVAFNLKGAEKRQMTKQSLFDMYESLNGRYAA